MRNSTVHRARQALLVSLVSTSLAGALASRPAHAQVAPVPPGAYTIQEIGNLGGSLSQAMGINNKGDVVGYAFNALGFAQAFENATYLPYSPSYARGVNAGGTMVGFVDASGGAGCYRAFRGWPSLADPIRALPPTYRCTEGMAINNRGDVAADAIGVGTRRRAHLFSQKWINLGVPPGVSASARTLGKGINDAQAVVGYYDATNSTDLWQPGSAFYWDSTFKMVDLNNYVTYPPQFIHYDLRMANAINQRGQIVGFGAPIFSPNLVSGYLLTRTLYDPVGKRMSYSFRKLGTLPKGGISYAQALNSAGTAVGAAYRDPSGVDNRAATMFTKNRVYDLNAGLRLTDALRWQLFEATGVNDHGQIVGWGMHDGIARGFLLTPRATIALTQDGLGSVASLAISGSKFTPNGQVTIEVRPDDIGGPLYRSIVTTADANGRVSWNGTIPCDQQVAVNAWDQRASTYSNAPKIKIACIH